MLIQPKYNRVEIIADLGFGDRVVLFADFSVKGISLGIPYHIRILKGTPEEPQSESVIDETQRTTTHADGRVKTHWPIPSGESLKGPWETSRPALKSWASWVSQSEELVWSNGYKTLLESYLVRPKRKETSPRTLQIFTRFTPGSTSSAATYTILKPSDLPTFMLQVPLEVQAWQITGGWPWVILTLSNVENPMRSCITEAGRAYR